MFSIGAYNALETAIVTFDTFKRYRGLYFWSLNVSNVTIAVSRALYAPIENMDTIWMMEMFSMRIPAMARFVSQASNLSTSIPFMIGWYAMVTGQAVVGRRKKRSLGYVGCRRL
jgi:hypothetical protein